ncbi:hypothetical protein E3N88_34480 [Mikania micrantha]|uniref:Uncharacterized protein n=1 Tax=Mikania micrantha TaxID=192012 RepID=A0A5N6LY91_9ASTR|nr:hypothetical protein E3N88_34480 [Mikania micrantha]
MILHTSHPQLPSTTTSTFPPVPSTSTVDHHPFSTVSTGDTQFKKIGALICWIMAKQHCCGDSSRYRGDDGGGDVPKETKEKKGELLPPPSLTGEATLAVAPPLVSPLRFVTVVATILLPGWKAALFTLAFKLDMVPSLGSAEGS